jgi:hypothetical protein
MLIACIVAAAGLRDPDAGETRARAVPPDVTSAFYWEAACACATLWLAFLIYAVCQALG